MTNSKKICLVLSSTALEDGIFKHNFVKKSFNKWPLKIID